MTKFKDYLGVIIALAAVVGTVSGGLSYFARASDLQLVQLRLDQKIVADQLWTVQQQIWAIEDRNRQHGADCNRWPDERDIRQYRELKIQMDQLQQKQRTLMK